MEKYIWSLDISTTNIGFALWDLNGKLIELKHLELKISKDVPIDERLIHKAEVFRKYALEYKTRVSNELNGEIINTIVEQPIGGSMNINTVAMLHEFNGMARYALFQIFNIHPKLISVHESRKIFFPELVNISYKKNKKTGVLDKIETLSFPKEYIDKKKLYIWKKVCKLEPQIEWFYGKDGQPKDINYDMSDSFVVGYSGMRKFKIIE